MFNDRIGRVKDNLSRTVILLEFIDLGIGIIFFKIKDIADIRAAPPIDALVNIADGTKVVFRGTDEFGQKILHMVRILVFIDHDILELMLVFSRTSLSCCSRSTERSRRSSKSTALF